MHQLYNTLVELDSNPQIKPSLAKSWEISSNGLIYTFHLRTDVYFHNNAIFTGGKGRLCTAQDVVMQEGKNFGRQPCGTGPFQMYLWQDGGSPDTP
ncbi:ABC transporter substrate-binding protein [Hydrotalea sp.]|uniref:ABC transporter substrate-binding protein n=1 Tax=Hydrotalea sp. TaxID=2881279 RepID=UPI002611BEE3|nr:ABC transporter substrate-binding protein [Hydrotalea sp.]